MPDHGFTHGAKFHADDVFSTAFLRLLNPAIEVTRGFDVPEDFDGIVYDIGRGKYDHHQQDKEIRENGVPYAAFGLLWREFGTCFLTEHSICRKLSRWYGVEIVPQGAEAGQMRYTGIVKRYETFAEMARLLERTNQIRAEVRDEKIVLCIDRDDS